MSKFLVFSKHFNDLGLTVEQLADAAEQVGCDGYDLAVRPGHPVHPDNAADALPAAAELMRSRGLTIGMVTGNFDLLWPDDPGAEALLAAMDAADVRLVKLGYYKFDPHQMDYWSEVDRIRDALAGWAELGATHNVAVCYHTHSNRCMGLNAGMLMHLLRGLDAAHLGAFIDSGHLMVEGEEFAVAVAMVKEYLRLVALKDLQPRIERKNGHGVLTANVVPAGTGGVDWTAVFDELVGLRYTGPISVHCEFTAPGAEFLPTVAREVAFFRRHWAAAEERASEGGASAAE